MTGSQRERERPVRRSRERERERGTSLFVLFCLKGIIVFSTMFFLNKERLSRGSHVSKPVASSVRLLLCSFFFPFSFPLLLLNTRDGPKSLTTAMK